jgi:hypothetical protein
MFNGRLNLIKDESEINQDDYSMSVARNLKGLDYSNQKSITGSSTNLGERLEKLKAKITQGGKRPGDSEMEFGDDTQRSRPSVNTITGVNLNDTFKVFQEVDSNANSKNYESQGNPLNRNMKSFLTGKPPISSFV